MKQYTITVNGVAYDVTVEEKNGGVVSAPKAVEKSAPAASAPVASAPQAAAKEGNVAVSAPMPGKILAVKAKEGDSVKAGDVLLVLEAMKMENDIVAPQDGVVASINVKVGDSVESGAKLASLNA
ncbi:biotin/lipoyl-containing protein [Oribacterium sinus]|jgi:glutaconyl-coA decarboxylase|uniref:Biotin/lipoyl-binding protein n=1 Tax=Oribacterium sinus TaxID=237576 RepID=A0A930DPC5_9FIRM|nr:biotin/lipoyl-containing protein [Oribacterium sinus]MBF1273312.1 biotin/lipoyl-binding protein [Oribacterium sinus]